MKKGGRLAALYLFYTLTETNPVRERLG